MRRKGWKIVFEIVSVGTLIFGYPDRQVVRILIVSFLSISSNANLQKGRSGGSGPAAFPMIKLAKIWKRARMKFAQLGFHTFPLGESLFYTQPSP